MYAIIKTAGKQFKVKEGDVLNVTRLKADEGATIDLKEVLLLSNGDDLQIGQPYVNGASVKLNVVRHFKGKKLKIVRSKRRKGYVRRVGYRHAYTEIKVESIIH